MKKRYIYAGGDWGTTFPPNGVLRYDTQANSLEIYWDGKFRPLSYVSNPAAAGVEQDPIYQKEKSLLATKQQIRELEKLIEKIEVGSVDLSNYYTKDEIDKKQYLVAESDPSVPAWAKQAKKPSYNYSEINNTPNLTVYAKKTELFSGSYNDLANKPTINGQELKGNIVISTGEESPNYIAGNGINIADDIIKIDDTVVALKSELFNGSYNDLKDKPTIPNIDGLASITYVNNGLNEKLNKRSGYSLVADSEIARLSQVTNYDDTKVKTDISNLESVVANKAAKVHSHIISDVTDLSVTLNGFASKNNTYTKEEVDNKLTAIYRPKGGVADYENLPKSNNSVGDTYTVLDTGAEYTWTVDGTWEYLGEKIDLSAYAKKTELFSGSYNDLTDKPTIPSVAGLASETYVNNAVANKADKSTVETLQTTVNNKVEKKSGYSLVPDGEITRLSKVNNYDDTQVKADITALQKSVAAIQSDIDTIESDIDEALSEVE